jgi:hypothetical protein
MAVRAEPDGGEVPCPDGPADRRLVACGERGGRPRCEERPPTRDGRHSPTTADLHCCGYALLLSHVCGSRDFLQAAVYARGERNCGFRPGHLKDPFGEEGVRCDAAALLQLAAAERVRIARLAARRLALSLVPTAGAVGGRGSGAVELGRSTSGGDEWRLRGLPAVSRHTSGTMFGTDALPNPQRRGPVLQTRIPSPASSTCHRTGMR